MPASLLALGGDLCRGGGLVACWEQPGGASRGAWRCPSVKVFSTASGQGDAHFKVKPANYVTSQMGV